MQNSNRVYAAESLWVQLVKVFLLSISALGYSWQHIDGMARLVVVGAVILAALLAAYFERIRLRLVWCIVIAIGAIFVGLLGSALTLNTFGAHDVASTITVSRFWYYSALVLGIVLITRSLALRYSTMRFAESVLIVGTLVYLFFGHRDFNLTSPREFADYLYTNGYNPIEVYRYLGIGIGFLSLFMLFARTRFSRAAYSIGVLAIILLLLSGGVGSAKLSPNIVDPLGLRSQDDGNSESDEGDEPDDQDESDDEDDEERGGSGHSKDDDSSQSDQKNKNKDSSNSNGNGNSSNNSNGNSSNNEPVPVAVAVFYDEYDPPEGILYFRQNVLSEYDGNHLVASSLDSDVISTMPVAGAKEAVQVQNASLHTNISTSMFLMQEHAQPPQLAMGQKIFTIQNPDPAVFVSAYGVESLGMTMDVSRLIGRHSIPADWSQDMREHYLRIPDDPRYRALSDIIVRQIDPRFAGDDIVKALYIKSWLEKEGFYTQKTRHIDANDPTASFLFGSLRGYCVHFAHSAALLLRSQGIASRVAIGYAVDNQLRGTNSAVLILGNQAHAWPEIYVDGVGWVTFDIYPENGDEPPRAFVDRELESLFGELARDDKSGGKAPEAVQSTFEMPYRMICLSILGLLLLALSILYVRKIWIVFSGYWCKDASQLYRPARSAIYLLEIYGYRVSRYSSYDSMLRREFGENSATEELYQMAVAARFGGHVKDECIAKTRALLHDAHGEARRRTPLWRRILGWLNPIV